MTCKCGGHLQPLNDLDWDTTKPDSRTRMVEVTFICSVCARTQVQRLPTPVFTQHHVRNLMRSINSQVKVNSWDLLGTITLNTPDAEGVLYENIIDGMQAALEHLQYMDLVQDVEWETFSFRLTLHGWIALLHSAY